MAGLDEIGVWLQSEINKSAEELSKKVSDACLKYIQNVTYETPVDTSRAASNWVVSIGDDPSSFIEPHFMGTKGSTGSVSKARTIALADGILGSRRFGEIAYLVNRVYYIDKIEQRRSYINNEIARLEADLNNIVGG